MNYKLLAPALNDLDAIEKWVLDNFGEQTANKAIDTLLEVFEMLAEFPEAGPERPDIFAPPMRFFSSFPNLVMYEPGNPLFIHRILPARMDLSDL